MPDVEVVGSRIYYEEAGAGTPIVFLHGNPASSHLWRHVIPAIGEGYRCLAPDLIGMGRSGKPDIAYAFADHARHLDAWFEALGLGPVVLVGIDWGGALAFDRAARKPDGVRGIAFMETIVRPMTWADFPGPSRQRLETLRAPGSGERVVLDENFFMDVALKATVLGGLGADDLAAYRSPYPTRESRRPLLAWPRAFPIEGEPADVSARVARYAAWLAASADMPKLLLTFHSSPTLLIGAELAAWCQANIAGLETEDCGAAAHLAPEDQPAGIARAIRAWLQRHAL